MSGLLVASYARVSSEQQAEAHTIASQVAALRQRVAEDGLTVPAEREFLDEGYSGATLLRPALEQLRDLIAEGGVERLYVHSPDRLARKYAYQALLLDEFQAAGVEVVFLNRALGQSSGDDLLLQVQGMVAEYERAKILERSRRGERHGAQLGVVSVLCGAPYGYHYVRKDEGGGVARFELVLEEARVVRQIFQWIGQERATIGEVVRRLNAQGTPTRTGKHVWDRTVIWAMLKNPAYQGTAAFGKTRAGPRPPKLWAQRGQPLHPRQPAAAQDRPAEEWLLIPVPALVEPELFAAVQEQLAENRQRARQSHRGALSLVQGLVVCGQCGYAYYGKPISPSARKGPPRSYAYYRCLGSDAYRFGGERLCRNPQVRTDRLEAAVWHEVRALLKEPGRLEREYQQRLAPPDQQRTEATTIEAQRGKLRQGMARLIDSYTEGFVEKEEFEPRVARLRQRLAELDEQARYLADEAALQSELRLVIGRLEDFAAQVEVGLATADWAKQREIIRTLVKRVEIQAQAVNVVFRVPPDPFVASPAGSGLPDCGWGDDSPLRGPLAGGEQLTALHDPRREPSPDGFAQGGEGGQLVQERLVVEAVEALGDIGVQDILGLLADTAEDGPERVVAGASWSKAIAVGLEPRFPFGFEGELGQALGRPVGQGRNAQGTLFSLFGLGDPDPSGRLRLLVHLQASGQFQPLGRGEGFHPVHARCCFARVVLGHPAHRQAFGRPGLQQESLELVDCLGVAAK